eukprot:CAMPEP_0183303482 /NCGR_PEP_ID=MMETSP0160_2-20130417/8903_1 /TAXON_ID=2839 ORGANISM="Odontella Sinensis, Strain Grunow 1884" /NCGR_SAMPLE_ID=MMETSP0160_2 /ASSEMBLY_ACC=CAM_ASM_000250 /LENGTH=143 /DNA_ID=CAMNT_0025466391 /DNA_START=42 /DNA_END=473 /DNA_ORIENTATION=-
MSTEEQAAIRQRMESFYEDWIAMNFRKGENFDEVWDEYFCEDCQIIRPSGNPLAKEAWRGLISSDDVTYNNREGQRLVSIDSCKVFADGKAAVMTFTMDIYFDYKGAQNNDRAKVSLVWACVGGKWKIMHFHRATGQPIPQSE